MNTYKKLGILMLVLVLLIFVARISTAQETSDIPDKLKLLTDKENILGNVVMRGEAGNNDVVKYAYRSDIQVSTEAGEHVMQAAGKTGISNIQEDVNKRTKHARTFSTSNPNVYITEIISGVPQYYKDQDGEWWVADYATTTVEAYELQTKETPLEEIIGFFTGKKANALESTFYPDPNTETSSVDGVLQESTQADWATIIAGTGDSATDNGTMHSLQQINSSETSNEWSNLVRAVFLFDTSSIGDTDSIDSATLSIASADFAEGAKIDSLGITPDVALVSSDPASNTALAAGDFDSLSGTELASRISYSSWSTTDGTYNIFTLNALGLANISRTGVSKFGVRNGNYDIDATTPSWSSNVYSAVRGYYSDQSGTTKDPKLVVTHTATDFTADDNHIFFNGDASLTADRFIGQQELCTTGNRVDCELIIPQDITVKGMSCFIQDGSASDNVTFTFYDDGTATDILCSANGVQNCSIADSGVNVAADSLITIFADETFGAISGHVTCAIRYVNDI